ncbi:MAG: PHP domain-containing protein [Deltaproteobacteria bacterium]|nr:PHP domain-containing protein [Deltaproteobacteria bacterium]
MHRSARLLPLLALVPSFLLLPSCAKEGCLDPSDDECTVPSPCEGIDEFTCTGGEVAIKIVESAADVPGGLDALGSPGDIRLSNDKVVVIIDALDHPHYVGPTGGALLDMSTVGDDNDSLRQMIQGTGVLPEEAANYTEMKLIEEDGLVAVQFRGTLDSRPDMHIATRYELRPCEPGVRVRTELVSMEADSSSVTLFDASYFGDREMLDFTPGKGVGFEHPSFGLSTIGDATMSTSFMVGAAHSEPAATYGTVACDRPELWGFQSNNIATNGTQARPLAYGDFETFERFIAIAKGSSVADAANILMEVRRQLFDEGYVVIEGVVAVDGAGDVPIDSNLRASVHVSEGAVGDPREELTPWNHSFVDSNGRFLLAVPADRSYVLEVETYGIRGTATAVDVAETNVDVGTLTIPQVGQVTISHDIDGAADHLQVLVLPSDDGTAASVTAAMFDQFVDCGPLLGAPYGASPACNRVLLNPEEPVTVGILPGTYDFFAVAGPFSSMAVQRSVQIAAGAVAQVDLSVEMLPDMRPPLALSGDFHVHGGSSFDSNIPHDTRVAAWLAARLEVLATTEHDTAWDYAEARTRLGADDRLRVMVGTESTGHILYKALPDQENPQVFGHWNIWPLPFDPEGPYRGAPWDELTEPAFLFERAEAQGFDKETGVIQLNHPIEEALFARDQGWATSLGIDGTQPLPMEFDGTQASQFLYTPPGSMYSNGDYDIQEVMNGSSNHGFHKYRAFWHYLLNQGILRAGTANADSHTLTDNVVGTPRTVVFSGDTQADFDPNRFNAALKEGRAVGTNGPSILLRAFDVGGNPTDISLNPFQPDESSSMALRVQAAPWVPVEEVRIIVNGVEVKVYGPGELSSPADPLGTTDLVRLDVDVPLSELLPSDGSDAWLVVEAGRALIEQADLDCDGFPDTGDNNGDGTIDWQDVEELEEEPDEACYEESGPILEPPAPPRGTPEYAFWAVTPGGYPLAFSNPFIFDRNGDGDFDAPGVGQ